MDSVLIESSKAVQDFFAAGDMVANTTAALADSLDAGTGVSATRGGEMSCWRHKKEDSSSQGIGNACQLLPGKSRRDKDHIRDAAHAQRF